MRKAENCLSKTPTIRFKIIKICKMFHCNLFFTVICFQLFQLLNHNKKGGSTNMPILQKKNCTAPTLSYLRIFSLVGKKFRKTILEDVKYCASGIISVFYNNFSSMSGGHRYVSGNVCCGYNTRTAFFL